MEETIQGQKLYFLLHGFSQAQKTALNEECLYQEIRYVQFFPNIDTHSWIDLKDLFTVVCKIV